jgi:signal transduction histidine kinase
MEPAQARTGDVRSLGRRAFSGVVGVQQASVTVLVIQEPGARTRIADLLGDATGWRFRVESVSGLAEGLVRLTAGGVDLVVLDVALSDGRGLTGLRLLADAIPGVPVVLLCDAGDEGARLGVQAIRLGAQDYLSDGDLTPSRLSRILGHAVERHRAAAGLRGLSHHLEARIARRNQALEEANRELEAFSYTVSHDLRAPLCTIAGLSEILLTEYGEALGAEARGCLERIARAGASMERLIQALLDLSRAKETELRRRRVDLSILVREAVDELGRKEPDRRVDVLVQEGLLAMGDPALLKLVVDNLVGNAWKFTSNQPSARIEFVRERLDGEDVYQIRDDGPGFDLAQSHKLFQPFQRLDDRTEGLGVGLATVERVIRRHRGRIWASSGPRGGATFCFTLGRQTPADSSP